MLKKHGRTKQKNEKKYKEEEQKVVKEKGLDKPVEAPVITKEDRKRVRDLKKLKQKQLLSKFDPRYLGQTYIGGKFNKNWWDMTEEEKEEYSELAGGDSTYGQTGWSGRWSDIYGPTRPGDPTKKV